MSMMTAQMTPVAPYDRSCLVLLFVLPFLLLIDLGPIYSLLEALGISFARHACCHQTVEVQISRVVLGPTW